MDLKEKALAMHKEWNGKLETIAKSKVNSREDLAIAYTPGVAEPCKVIAEDKEAAYTYTMKANTVAVISDGSAVLGLGNIGPYAAMPVMEGKCVLFKEFGDVNAVPICLDTQDTEEIIATIKNIAPAFGGINLEDISAPRCFEIEERLKAMLDIPVFHDDQHGTAIVVLAGIINGLKVVGKKKEEALQMGKIFMKMIKGDASEEEIDSLEEASALRDIAHMPARVKCAVLGWRTLKEALLGEDADDDDDEDDE